MSELLSYKLRGSGTYQDQVECTRSPFLNGFLPILRDVVFDFLLPHESCENGLINGVICTGVQLCNSHRDFATTYPRR